MPISNAFLDLKRQAGDPPADTFIEDQFSSPEAKAPLSTWMEGLISNSGLDNLPIRYHAPFIENSRNLPEWADNKLMEAGSAFFVKHAEQVMQLLGLLSLPYCYAAADGAMVLYLSQRLQSDLGKRLFSTADFIWDVMSPDAFTEKGKGYSSILKIRLTHAAARYYTLKSGRWNSAYGVPVNQEDMAGTNLAFSLIVIRGLRKMGYSISYKEQQSFLHLWNVIGYLLGLDDGLIPQDGKLANALELMIRNRHFKPSEQGRALTKSLLNYFETAVPENVTLKGTISLMRYLLGEEIADLLDVPAVNEPGYLPYLLNVKSKLPNIGFSNNPLVVYQQKHSAFKKQSRMLFS